MPPCDWDCISGRTVVSNRGSVCGGARAATAVVSYAPSVVSARQGLLDKPQALFALVLSPTRELAIQIAEQFEYLGAGIGVRTARLVGGIDMMAQVSCYSHLSSLMAPFRPSWIHPLFSFCENCY